MQILEPGQGWQVEVRCTGIGNGGGGCNALLGANRDDLRFFQGSGGDGYGSSESAVCVKCPQCFTVTDLQRNDWPPRPTLLQSADRDWLRNTESTEVLEEDRLNSEPVMLRSKVVLERARYYLLDNQANPDIGMGLSKTHAVEKAAKDLGYNLAELNPAVWAKELDDE